MDEYYNAILAFGLAVSFLENSLLQDQSIKFFEYIEFRANTDL